MHFGLYGCVSLGKKVGKRKKGREYELHLNKPSGMAKEQSQAVSQCASFSCQNRGTCHKICAVRQKMQIRKTELQR